MEQAEQRHFVKVLRGLGFADSTIDQQIRMTRGAMHHCARESKLLYEVPPALPKKEWEIRSDEDDIVAYKLPEIIALFNAAAKRETWWRFMNLATHAPRTMTIIEAPWIRFTIGKDEEPRWNLNPPGKRRTSKRRPIIPLCPSLVAELRSWKRDAVRVVSNGKGSAIERGTIFASIRKAAGIKRGSAKSIRKFVRTWCAVNGVPETMADWFMGHADEGSETGQEHYKDKQPEYMAAVVGALEKLYDTLRDQVSGRRFAGGPEIEEDQPTIDDLLKSLRGSGVSKLFATA
jgi:integrase